MITTQPHLETEGQEVGELATIVFFEIINTLKLMAQAGDLAVSAALRNCLAIIGKTAVAYQGQVMKCFGDGYMILFQNAEQAFSFAVNVQRGLTENPCFVAGDPLKYHLGLHAGKVIKMSTSYGEDAFGDSIPIAARLTDLADPDQIVLSNTVRFALPKALQSGLGSVEAVHVKGALEPIFMTRVDFRKC